MSKRRAHPADCQPCGLPQPVRWDLLGWTSDDATPPSLLLEDGTDLLLEDGSNILLES